MSTLETELTAVSGSALVPARQPRMVSRRSVLGGLGLGSLAALVAPMFGPVPTATAAPTRPQDTPTPPSAGYTPLGPFTVGASCDLTEDYFLTDEVLIDLAGGDRVMPFTTQAGGVEAVVVTGVASNSTQLAHLAHDPATTSGWAYTTIDTGFSRVVDAAVYGTSGQQPKLLVSGLKGEEPRLITLAYGQQGWTTTSDVPAAPTSLKSGIGPSGQFFYGWGITTTSVIQVKTTLNVSVYDATHPTGTTVLSVTYLVDDLQLDDLVMRYDPQGKDGWIVLAFPGLITGGQQTGVTSFAIPPTDPMTTWIRTPNLDTMLGAYGSGPDIVWQDTSGQVNITIDRTAQLTLGATKGSASSSVTTWMADGRYQFAFCLDETVSVTSQLASTSPLVPYQFTPAIPMLPGTTRVFGVDTDPTQSVLFAVDLDASLSILSYGPTGWTQNAVHQASATVQEVTSWRCQIPVTDANNLPVPGATVQVTTDRPVAVWQEGETDGASSTLMPGTPLTFTCDVTGELALALPTNELDSAQLTVQALDSNNKPTGSPLVVSPDTDVQAFLAGTGSLSSVGSKLTGDAMVGAQSTSWDTVSQTYKSQGPLFPVITSLTGGQQSAAASACAAALVHVANLPTAVPAAASDVRSACLDLTGSAPTFATSNDSNHFNSSIGGETNWWDKAKNDVGSFFHGLRHGAIHLSKLVSSWADDAKTWTLNLAIHLGDDIEHAVNFIVKTAKDAIHAISSFFQALGADIEKAWKWLKHFVLGVIKDADVTAKQLQAWFADLTTAGVNIINNLTTRSNTFFQDLEGTVSQDITTLKGDVEGLLFGSECPTPTPTKDSSGDNSNLLFKGVEDFFKVMQDSPANWLWNKIKKHLPSLGSNNLNVSLSTFQDTVTDLEGALQDAGESVTDLYNLVYRAFQTFTTPGAFNQANIGDIFDDLNNFADDVLKTLDKIVDAVLELIKDLLNALQDLLNSEFLPSVIVDILKLAGIDATVSIARVLTLIVAYHITIVHNLWVGEGPLFDFSTDTSTHHTGVGRGAADKNGFGLDLAAGCVQFIWSEVDAVIDLDSVGAKSMGPLGSLFNLMDWVLPIIMTVLQWPTPWNATTTPKPCSNWDFTDGTQWGQYKEFLPGIILSTIVPWAVQAIADIWQRMSPTSTNAEQLSDFVTPIVQSAMAAMNNILGAWWQWSNQNASKTDKANAVLDWTIPNLSYLDCPLAIEEVVDASEGISLGVKLIIDYIANFGATAICFQQAVAAHG